MPDEPAVGFWSYTHEDNKLDGGAILKLAELIMEEYNLLSGEPLNLFIDRDSIVWGQEWRTRIDSTLTQTTFFIPIITPRYFNRPECRRELLEFAAKAKSLGVGDLLLPILYIETRDFSVDNPDEVVALVARTQYADWHSNRLLEPSSREYRTAVNSLTRRLLEIARDVAEVQFSHELNSDLEEGGEVDGFADIIDKIMALLPDWLNAVMDEKINSVQILATYRQYMGQVDKLRSRRAPASAVFTTQIRLTKELLPLVERRQKDARIYLTRSVELDPLMSTLIRQVAEYPDSVSLIAPIKDAIDEAMVEIRKLDVGKRDPNSVFVRDEIRKMRHLGRVFQRCSAIYDNGAEAAMEGNDTVRRWAAELNIAVALPESKVDEVIPSSDDDL
jgi:hypothetical protein